MVTGRRLPDQAPAQAGGRGRRPSGDWWIHAVLPLGALHAALYFALQARPGPIAVVLWRWGPPILLTATAALLLVPLVSALRMRQTWSWRRALGLLGACALVATLGLYRTFPSEHDGNPSAIALSVPFAGAATVAWGGRAPATNYHVTSPPERWGYDLLVTLDGSSYRGSGESVDDYHAYGLPVFAPVDGRVVAAHDGEPDASPGQPEPAREGGNRIVLEVAPRQFLFLAHFKAGSVRVRPGDVVRRGDLIGNVGNSGNSTEPHLHLHLQDTPDFSTGQGIPMHFREYVQLRSGTPVERGMPEGGVDRGRYVGDIIAAAPQM